MDTKFKPLVGESNFIDWHRDFQREAKDKDVWDLLTGKFTVIENEPDFDDYKVRLDSNADTAGGAAAQNGQNGNRELRSRQVPPTPATPGIGIDTGGATTNNIYNYISDNSATVRFEHDVKKYEKSQKKVKNARSLLQKSVSSTIGQLIRDKDDPVEAYNYLVDKYKPSDKTARQNLIREFNGLKLAAYKYNAEEYIAQFYRIQGDLMQYGKEVSDDELCDQILLGLPPSYENFAKSYSWLMRSMGKADGHDLESLTAELIKEAGERVEKAKQKKELEIHATKIIKTSKDGKVKIKFDGECNYCHKRGHKEADCWKKNPSLMPDFIKKKIAEKSTDKTPSTKTDNDKDKAKAKSDKVAGLTITEGSGLDPDFGTPHYPSNSSTPADPSQMATCSHGQHGQSGREVGVDSGDEHDRATASRAFMAMALGDFQSSDTWLVDSGCNMTIVNDKKWFTTFYEDKRLVGTADKKISLDIEGSGRVIIGCQSNDGTIKKILLKRVMYAPHARCNLLSMSKLLDDPRYRADVDKSGMDLFENGVQFGHATMMNGLYHLKVQDCDAELNESPLAAVINFEHPVWKWHRRLGHLSLPNMRELLKFSDGIDLTDQQIKNLLGAVCPVCATTRALVKIPRDPAKRRANEPGQVIHADTWGKYPIKGWDGTHYFLFLTDDATRYTWAIRFSNKRDLPDVFKKLHTEIQTSLNITIRNYRFDNEFEPGPIGRWLEKKGIGMETIEPYAHYQNGAAERPNRTIREKGAAILQEDNIIKRMHDITVGRTQELLRETKRPESLWPEAVEHAVWLKNRSPARALKKKEKKTPWEALYGNKPTLDREKVWGSRAWVTLPPENRGAKLHAPRGWMGYWVGRHSESVDKIFSPEKVKVYKIGVARVEDGKGLQDPQPLPTYTDRVPTAHVDIPDTPDYDEEETDDSEDQEVGGDDDGRVNHNAPGNDHNIPQQNSEDVGEANDDNNDDDNDDDTSSEIVTSRYFANMAQYDSDFDSDISAMSDTDDEDEEQPVRVTVSAVSRKRKTVSATPKTSIPKAKKAKGRAPRKYTTIKTPAGSVVGPLSTLKADPNKCDSCFRLRLLCDRNTTTGPKCASCQRRGYRCIDQTKESKALIPKENLIPTLPPTPVAKCRMCHTNGYKCSWSDDSGICDTCQRKGKTKPCNMDLTGVKSHWENKGPKAAAKRREISKRKDFVTDDKKCDRCFRLHIACDGKIPCCKCKGRPKLEKQCREQKTDDGAVKSDLPACMRCFSQARHCDRGTPCRVCDEVGKVCVYAHDGGLSKRCYATRDIVKQGKHQYDEEEVDEDCCIRCKLKPEFGKPCQGTPCGHCVKAANDGTLQSYKIITCAFRRSGGVQDRYYTDPWEYKPGKGSILRENYEAFILPQNLACSTLEAQKEYRTRNPIAKVKLDGSSKFHMNCYGLRSHMARGN